MARFCLLLFGFTVTLSAWGQTPSGTLVGLVHDTHHQPAPYAALKLLRASDSTLVTGTVADQAGRYQLSNVPVGPYRLRASLVGMTETSSPIVTVLASQTTAVGTLLLGNDEKTLDAVTVRARKVYIEQQADKTVLNVATNGAAQSKTAYELLQQAPGVVIDPNDNIRMAGKQGVNVFIDGKPTNLSSADVANLLRATPASNIATVELITNPSARFDAQGGAGIINIRFRRDKSLGLNGNASASYGQSDHHRALATLDLNYRARHLNLYGNTSLSDNYQITNVAYDRSAAGAALSQRGYDRDGTRAIVYKAGADYFIGASHTLGLVVSGNAAANQFGTYTTSNLFSNGGRLDTTLINGIDNPSWNKRVNAALNYHFVDTLGHDLNIDVDYTRFGNESPSLIGTDYRTASGQPLLRRQSRFDASTTIGILTLKGDFINEWKARRLKLETGLKHTDVSTDNDLLAFVGGTPEAPERPDATRTNRFTYRELVSAAYASLNHAMGKWTVQAGLRAEHSTVRGRSTDLAENVVPKPDTTYLNLFPTAFVQYQASDKSQFGLNYGRRIGRPSYQDMNPFIYQVDPYTSQRGNPYLRPTYTHNLEVSYTYKWATTLKLAYSLTDDFATDVIRQEGLVTYSTVANVGTADALNLSFSSPLPITKWWDTYFYAGATWTRFQGNVFPNNDPAGAFDRRAFAFEGYMQHSFTLSKLMSAQVSGFWNAPTTQTLYRNGGLGALNLSLSRKVMHERGKVSLTADDVLNTMRWRQSGTFNGTPGQVERFDLARKWESRRLTLRFSYRFGSNDVKAARDRETGTDASRIKTKGNL
ncbi:TonB-dependent receptor [Fibrella aestuarina BUZ 2]|uniref:TonB-dependent receptor n=1 Tax=Fibrella aestuarina BUZ 2 TaxID=1166018 RepID=I0K7H8_9BACT|nr:outer membrane beta-barrel protein [Fibrella aestuarina]CCH00081.1 TonB-dependent receptor [Fibrella aestuarina BUZ 2]